MKLNHPAKTLLPIATLALFCTSTQAATVSLTSVDQLDFNNVVKAYDFGPDVDSTFDIGGVTFTRHHWTNGVAHDDLTVTGLHASGGNLGSPNITLGGTAADRTNLNALLDDTNFGSGQDGTTVALSIAVPNGTYNVQYITGSSNNRENELFDTNGGGSVSLGSYTGGGNFLITGTVTTTDGTLDLDIFGSAGSGDGRPIIAGLIINAVPEPSTTALLGLGGLALVFRRRK